MPQDNSKTIKSTEDILKRSLITNLLLVILFIIILIITNSLLIFTNIFIILKTIITTYQIWKTTDNKNKDELYNYGCQKIEIKAVKPIY